MGPCFYGNNTLQLSAYQEPFNGEGNCVSWANFFIPLDEKGNNMLTG